MTCPDCKGKGTITLLTAAEPCAKCGGTGEACIVPPYSESAARAAGMPVNGDPYCYGIAVSQAPLVMNKDSAEKLRTAWREAFGRPGHMRDRFRLAWRMAQTSLPAAEVCQIFGIDPAILHR